MASVIFMRLSGVNFEARSALLPLPERLSLSPILFCRRVFVWLGGLQLGRPIFAFRAFHYSTFVMQVNRSEGGFLTIVFCIWQSDILTPNVVEICTYATAD